MPTRTRTLRKLIKEHRKISFMVTTPNSERNIPLQNVTLMDCVLRKTRSGSTVILGRDLLKEAQKDMQEGRQPKVRVKRRRSQMVFRHYDVSRILRGSVKGL